MFGFLGPRNPNPAFHLVAFKSQACSWKLHLKITLFFRNWRGFMAFLVLCFVFCHIMRDVICGTPGMLLPDTCSKHRFWRWRPRVTGVLLLPYPEFSRSLEDVPLGQHEVRSCLPAACRQCVCWRRWEEGRSGDGSRDWSGNHIFLVG